MQRFWYRSRQYFIAILVVSLVVSGIAGLSIFNNGHSQTAYAQGGGSECDQDPNCVKTDSPGPRNGCVPATGAIRFVIKAGAGEFSIEFPSGDGSGVTGGYTVAYNGEQVCWSANPSAQDVSNVQVWQLTSGEDDAQDCETGTDEWDCSNVVVVGKCVQSSGVFTAVFTVTNTGDAGEGDMDGPTEYRLFANDESIETGTIQLAGGESESISLTGDEEEVIRLEVDQRPGHPDSSQPSSEVTLDCQLPPLIVIEGPISKINVNVITIFDIDIQLEPNDPILVDLAVDDVVRVDGAANFDGGVFVIIAVNIVVVNVDVIVIDGVVINALPAGCKLTGRGTRIRCKGSSKRT